MEICLIDFENKKLWDDTVKSFSDYDVYYLNGYVDGFRVHGDGEPALIYFYDENFKAINVVMKRSLADDELFCNESVANGCYDILTPYGYGGFLIEGTPDIGFANKYFEYCRENNIISEFVRFNPMTLNWTKCNTLYDVVELGDTIYIDLRDEEYVWNNFSGKNRNVIRKAIKENVEIHNTTESWIIDEFMEIYNSTMDRDDASDYYYFERDYYESMISNMKGNYEFFYAVKDEKIIAVSIIIFANGRMHYHLSASRREYQKFAPTNLLLWEACKYGIANGYKSFHLGGGVGSKEDGLYKFKKSFNKNENTTYCIGKAIFDQEKYDKLVQCRESIENEGFFPKYRG